MALGLLLAMNLFNYIDRQVLAAVEPEIRQSLLAGASPNDPALATKLGSLGSVLLNLASRLYGGHVEHRAVGIAGLRLPGHVHALSAAVRRPCPARSHAGT